MHINTIQGNRQSGKSTALALLAADFAATNPDSRILVIAPTTERLDIMFELTMEKALANKGYHSTVIVPSKTIRFGNGSQMHFRTPDEKSSRGVM